MQQAELEKLMEECSADAVRAAHEEFINWVAVFFFVWMAIYRDHIVVAVHVVIRGGSNIRPMRFDVTEMQAPGLVTGFGDELHRPIGHIGGF